MSATWKELKVFKSVSDRFHSHNMQILPPLGSVFSFWAHNKNIDIMEPYIISRVKLLTTGFSVHKETWVGWIVKAITSWLQQTGYNLQQILPSRSGDFQIFSQNIWLSEHTSKGYKDVINLFGQIIFIFLFNWCITNLPLALSSTTW